jgi:single-stranded-DNA-specific exonuclease
MEAGSAIPGQNHGEVTEHAGLFGLDSMLVRILHARGYDSPEKIDRFLHSSLSDLHSPFLMPGMFDAVRRLRAAVGSGEQIGIFADSDLDGITGLAVFHELFSRMEMSPFIRYLKNDETYGMTREIIDEFGENGVTLLLTVDSGIRDVREIEYARSLGIDVIVSDHHEQDADLPDAIIINPKIRESDYPFKLLAGVGIAFKICHAFLLSYLPSFNRLFHIITQEDGRYFVSHIRNCMVERVMTAGGADRVRELIASEEEAPIILLHEAGDADGIVGLGRGGEGAFDFCGFIGGVLKCKDSSLQGIRARLAMRPRHRDALIGSLNSIFLQTHLLAPDKIHGFVQDVLGLVSIGSIADMVPLVDENRILAKFGIEALNRARHPSISILYPDSALDSKTIGWGIAPLLNTPGRLGKTGLSVDFFIERDPAVLRSIITEISALNEDRKKTVHRLSSRILEDLDTGKIDSRGKLLYIKTDEIPEGFAGLLANRIADRTGKPVILVVMPGKDGIVKGSGRVREEVDFFSHVRRFSGRFERIGGHERAFGFTARACEIDGIISIIEDSLADSSVTLQASGEIAADCELGVDCITADLITQLGILEPFGCGNEEPVFLSRNIRFESFTMFGNDHGRYMISEGNHLSAVGWGMGRIMKDHFTDGRPLDVKYRLENNEYNGFVRPRMILVDIKFSEHPPHEG